MILQQNPFVVKFQELFGDYQVFLNLITNETSLTKWY